MLIPPLYCVGRPTRGVGSMAVYAGICRRDAKNVPRRSRRTFGALEKDLIVWPLDGHWLRKQALPLRMAHGGFKSAV